MIPDSALSPVLPSRSDAQDLLRCAVFVSSPLNKRLLHWDTFALVLHWPIKLIQKYLYKIYIFTLKQSSDAVDKPFACVDKCVTEHQKKLNAFEG